MLLDEHAFEGSEHAAVSRREERSRAIGLGEDEDGDESEDEVVDADDEEAEDDGAKAEEDDDGDGDEAELEAASCWPNLARVGMTSATGGTPASACRWTCQTLKAFFSSQTPSFFFLGLSCSLILATTAWPPSSPAYLASA